MLRWEQARRFVKPEPAQDTNVITLVTLSSLGEPVLMIWMFWLFEFFHCQGPVQTAADAECFFPGCNHRSSSFLQTQPLSGGGGNWADDWNYWEEEEINENLWWWWLWWYLVLSRTLLTMIMTLQVFSSSASAMDSPYYNPLISMNITYNAMMRPVPAHW